MLFNTDSSKQAQEIVFSRKDRGTNHGNILFNNMLINRETAVKHLGVLLDVRVRHVEHKNVQLKKANKVISVIRKNSIFP